MIYSKYSIQIIFYLIISACYQYQSIPLFFFVQDLLKDLLLEQYSCDGCGRQYKHRSSWYAHKKYECGKERLHSCPQCNYKSSRETYVKRHMILKHCSF